jgi:hypothetical protein
MGILSKTLVYTVFAEKEIDIVHGSRKERSEGKASPIEGQINTEPASRLGPGITWNGYEGRRGYAYSRGEGL